MTKKTKKSAKLVTIMWFGVTAALLGFATVYISLRLSGNLSPSSSPATPPSMSAKKQAAAPKNSAKSSDQITDRSQKDLSSAITELPGNATEISKNAKLSGNNIIPSTGLKEFRKGEMAGFLVHNTPKDLPTFSFVTVHGKTRDLSDWKGRIVLLNLWATWCIPCREEMPDLDKLKADLGGKQFDVVTISIDKDGLGKPARFFKKHKIRNLTLYGSSGSRLTTKLRAPGLPATILVGKNGKELGRLIGPAKWASPDAVRLIRAAMQ